MTKYVYTFNEGDATMRELLGGKGANLAEMTGLGLPVPSGFVVTTEACTRYYTDGATIAPEIEEEIFEVLKKVEEMVDKKFGDPSNPFLVSVRSGSRASMPGMMDTILNLGLNDQVVEGLAKLTENERFAYDSYRRFITMFSEVVMEMKKSDFDEIFDAVKAERGSDLDTDLTAEDLKKIVVQFKELYKKEKGHDFPQNPKVQLIESIKAVFRSWNNERAIVYRRMNNIPSEWGTAVSIQEMVYGNMGETSGTGVAFTRDPATGENKLYGEFLMDAQGEDVVAGVRTPEDISRLKELMPEIYEEFLNFGLGLEKHYKDMQDMEFTIENGKLFMLQTRSGKRTAAAALKIAVDMVEEGLLTKEEALTNIDPNQLDALLHPTFVEEDLKKATVVAKGLPASPGAATGQIYFDADDAVAAHEKGEDVILVRMETSPEDILGMDVSKGILTGRGGMTSHAAVVARGMGKCCVSGCAEVIIDEANKTMTDKLGKLYKEGAWISLDGTTGNVYGESIATEEAEMTGDFATIMEWADEYRTMGVRANADSGKDARAALDLGAEGIGLTRTEHMFFEADRIFFFRQMIVADDVEARQRALDKILPIQRDDFVEIFREMKGLPVTIRLLDPPLHEFLPTEKADIENLAKELGLSFETLNTKIENLHELNPMMGHRGCRLAISYPEIAVMQTRAIIEAALIVSKDGQAVIPEIMVPLVSEVKEFTFVKDIITETADAIIAEASSDLEYLVGTMIEIPRACLTADAIAAEADFFSFGTNDLTQMGYGLSRDDAGRILEDYYNAGIFEADPTARLDRVGVGKLMEIAVKDGLKANPEITLGICGEHGGEPSSVEFCHMLGLTYVSCSPFRVPIARLAAAQAAITEGNVSVENR